MSNDDLEISLEARLARMEGASEEIQRTLIRLEWRLERAGLLSGENISDQELYAAEEDLDPEGEDLGRVTEWLDKHQGDKAVRFADLERDIGGRNFRYILIVVLTYLWLGEQYHPEIRQLLAGHPPSEAGGIMRDPFKAWRRDGKDRTPSKRHKM
jgi:hypothetical protein